MPSADRSAGGSFYSSTPGPAIGEPDNATSSCRPSRDNLIPRGLFPTAIFSMSCPLSASMAKTWPPVSSETYKRVPDEVAAAPGAPPEGVEGADVEPDGGGALDAGSDRPQPDTPRAQRIARVEPST